MANNPPNWSEVRSSITLAHVLQARDTLLNNGTKEGNLVYFNKSARWGRYLAVFKGDDGNEYKPKELVRIAYLIYQNINVKSKSQIEKNYGNFEGFSGGDQTNTFLNSLRSSEEEYIIYDEDKDDERTDERTREIVGEDNLVFDQKTRKIVSKDGTVADLKATNEQVADEMDEDVKLLKQFKQMIFMGHRERVKLIKPKRH